MEKIKLLIIVLLIGVFAKAQNIKIEKNKFTFEKIEYVVQQDALDGNYRYISCYYKKDGENHTFLFYATRNYYVFGMHDYQTGRTFDFDVKAAEAFHSNQRKKKRK